MSEKRKKFESHLNQLIQNGELLHLAIRYECNRDEFTRKMAEELGKGQAEKYVKQLPDFRSEYQTWYSEAIALIKQILPDRLDDFLSHYECPHVRKDITYRNYMIRDYLQGLRITRGLQKNIVVDRSAAIPEFTQQLNIVKAAKATLDSALMNLTLTLQADIFDSELDSARALAKSGFLRAAGAICGVVLEKHLKQICANNSIVIRKKTPTLSDYNQALKDNDVIEIAEWRRMQLLTDIRNKCDHAKENEPTGDDISDLISGTNRALKTVF